MDNNIFLSKLNEEQRNAATSLAGPVFVVAGAGTGKTKTLTSRVAFLISQNIKPSEMLVLTFTNKAAREMEQRVAQILNFNIYFPYMATFHSFAYRFLKENVLLLENNLTKDFSVADESDSKKIIKEIIDILEIKTIDPSNLFKKISKYKIGEEIDFFSTEEEDIFLKILTLYEEKLIKENLIDFDNLLLFTKKILTENNEIKNKYRNKFKHILVDEFQDTDKVQYEILILLSSDNLDNNIFVVGDPDQSIYSFRGACYENNERFLKDFNPTVFNLNKNYRSTNSILNAANNLIAYNKKRSSACLNKVLKSDLGKGIDVALYSYPNYSDEAEAIVSNILNLINHEKVKPSEIAILIRSNFLSRVFEDQLIKAKVPYKIYGGISFFQRKEVKDFVAYLKLIVNPNSDYHLKRIINMPRRQIGEKIIKELELIKEKKNIPLFKTIDFYKESKVKDKLISFKNLIINLKNEIISFPKDKNIIEHIYNKIDYNSYLSKLADDIQRDKYFNIDQLSNIICEYREKYFELDNETFINKVVEDIELLTDVEMPFQETNNKVIISTFHQVKGLEFDTIFMPALEEKIIPNGIILKSEDADIEEERRIAYVGITRAKKRLFLSHSKTRYRFGTWHKNTPSRFINEIEIANDNVSFTKNNTNLVGNKVYHPVYKKGVVISHSESGILTIMFEENSQSKKFQINFPGLIIYNKE